MTEHAQPADEATHKVVDVLLPWFVNGTLDADESELVRQHLTECVECREQVQWLRDLHAACRTGSTRPGASSAFDRLRRELDAPTIRRTAIAGNKLRTALPWAIAAAVTAVALGGVWWMTDGSGLYRTLSAEQTARTSQGAIVVVFDPGTRESDVRRILRAADARIVDGPTASTGYVLDVNDGKRPKALATLRAERAVVLAEPLSAGAVR